MVSECITQVFLIQISRCLLILGHLKFVDFGTAKDMIQTDLNGQEFVGTPEYMSPGTVCVKNGGPPKNICSDATTSFSSNTIENVQPSDAIRSDGGIGLEADIWALGVVFYQMVFGLTPFQAPSPYLVFLRIKRDLVLVRRSNRIHFFQTG
jgi:3-phosphoinositide dependent protein kinase-1